MIRIQTIHLKKMNKANRIKLIPNHFSFSFHFIHLLINSKV